MQALTDPLYWLIMGHMTAGMLGILPWPLTRRWRDRMLWVWLATALVLLGVLLLIG